MKTKHNKFNQKHFFYCETCGRSNYPEDRPCEICGEQREKQKDIKLNNN